MILCDSPKYLPSNKSKASATLSSSVAVISTAVVFEVVFEVVFDVVFDVVCVASGLIVENKWILFPPGRFPNSTSIRGEKGDFVVVLGPGVTYKKKAGSESITICTHYYCPFSFSLSL